MKNIYVSVDPEGTLPYLHHLQQVLPRDRRLLFTLERSLSHYSLFSSHSQLYVSKLTFSFQVF